MAFSAKLAAPDLATKRRLRAPLGAQAPRAPLDKVPRPGLKTHPRCNILHTQEPQASEDKFLKILYKKHRNHYKIVKFSLARECEL